MASFPRSGNTFLRIVLHRLYGLRTSVIYDVDGVADRLGGDLVGFTERPAPIEELRASTAVHFVKTHRQRDDEVKDQDRAILLVRDGRDALVSWARQAAEQPGHDFAAELRVMITREKPTGTGSWGGNVLSWWRPPAPHRVLLRYEDLIRDPAAEAGRVLGALAPGLRRRPGGVVPSFRELHGADPGFFRRGHTGTHRDEIPADLHELFWSRPDNAEAMALLGYRP